MKPVIIQGSARSVGNTNTIVKLLQSQLACDIIDLNDFIIRQYDYEYMNKDDDFLPLMRRIVENYDMLIFATPVYWYSMSGIMKAFFDRISDCLDIEKDTGRKLRGKSMALISVSGDAERFDCLAEPFRLSAGYLGMNWFGDIHTWVGSEMEEKVVERVRNFGERLMAI